MFDDNEIVVKKSEIVFLSVKPVIMPSVLSQIRSISSDKLFISIAMGVSLNQLEQVCIIHILVSYLSNLMIQILKLLRVSLRHLVWFV